MQNCHMLVFCSASLRELYSPKSTPSTLPELLQKDDISM